MPGTSVSSVASGRQPNRRVRGRAEPGRNMQPGWVRSGTLSRITVQAAGSAPIDAAVGHQRAEPWQAYLAAVGVTREQQINTVSDESVQGRGLGRVHYAEPQVGRRIDRTGDPVVAVAGDMRVVHAAHLDV